MDELQMLRTVLVKEPSRDVVDQGRHKLQNAMRGPVRKRRTGWLAGGLGLAAAGAAAAVVIASGSTAPVHTPAQGSGQLSGQQVLLSAASTAETASQGAGTYWHVKTEITRPGSRLPRGESWTRRDGRTWALINGKVIEDPHRSKNFGVAGILITYDELQSLPTDPAALKAWTVAARKKALHGQKPFVGFVGEDGDVAKSLSYLLWQVPAPPKVRAAAFRTIASLPGVKSLGPVQGGKALGVSTVGVKLVIDPKTSFVREISFSGGNAIAISASEWTNQLPKAVSSTSK
ncbi:hypothetical protein Pth03_10320 [Planotetraspora thailandica]|uniref:Uncharacterized protein n=1 Tax=Planotetraspora thailandica TaxID=487172 RepID=A0A8J3UWQ1_9ACTN|nr:CU044_5270 family protein [Planotetraspora thailandica]GII52643.1 hypothetical protein Pth03_10320 [Planotetraspora thailandica]